MAKDLLVTWLKDAYAMEQAGTEMLERYIKDFDAQADIKLGLEQHLEETKRQAEQVKQCLAKLGSDVSGAKSMLGNIVGAVQGMGTSPFKDEPVKDMIVLHSSEHFAHASYLALAHGARALGEQEIANICLRIAEEERATAGWAEQQLPKVVEMVITKQRNER